MENSGKMQKEHKRSAIELEHYASYAKERLLLLLKNLPQKEMIAKINELDLSDRSLEFLGTGIALETEDYEICAAVAIIKAQRGLKNITD